MTSCVFMNFTLISFQLLLFSLFTFTSGQLPDVACAAINCGQGTCIASNTSLLGFDCLCNSGWKKMQIGPLTFPSCVVPNCTIDLQCSNGAPAPSPLPSPSPYPPLPLPPPPPTNPPPLNISSTCSLIWCGEGTCVLNGTGYYCQCYQGSQNLLNKTDLACFKPCAFGADCSSLGIGDSPLPLPLPLPLLPSLPSLENLAPPTSTSSGSQKNGSNEAPNCSRNAHALIIIVISATFLTWI